MRSCSNWNLNLLAQTKRDADCHHPTMLPAHIKRHVTSRLATPQSCQCEALQFCVEGALRGHLVPPYKLAPVVHLLDALRLSTCKQTHFAEAPHRNQPVQQQRTASSNWRGAQV